MIKETREISCDVIGCTLVTTTQPYDPFPEGWGVLSLWLGGAHDKAVSFHICPKHAPAVVVAKASPPLKAV